MSSVILCGPASWNQIVYLDTLPDPRPQTLFATRCYETLGGTSAGKALHLSSRGRNVLLRTVVGSDQTGKVITETLQRAGVPLEASVVPGPSERHLNLMTASGERLSIYLSTPGEPQARERFADEAAQAEAVVLDLAPWTRSIACQIGRSELPVWTDLHDYDGVNDFHRPFVAAASHVFLSGDALTSPSTYLHQLVDDGVRLAVCTLGADGAIAVDADHREWRVSAKPVDVVDTNGAGDAFFAGFLDAHLKGADVPNSLDAAATQAVEALRSPHLSASVSTEPNATPS